MRPPCEPPGLPGAETLNVLKRSRCCKSLERQAAPKTLEEEAWQPWEGVGPWEEGF